MNPEPKRPVTPPAPEPEREDDDLPPTPQSVEAMAPPSRIPPVTEAEPEEEPLSSSDTVEAMAPPSKPPKAPGGAGIQR